MDYKELRIKFEQEKQYPAWDCNATVKQEYIEWLERQLENCNLQNVSNRRELLLDFMTYVSPEAYATHSKAELADNYLSSNSC